MVIEGDVYMVLGYFIIFVITVSIIIYTILSKRRSCSSIRHRCKNRSRVKHLPERGKLMQLEELKVHFCESMAHDRFRLENKLVNKMRIQRSVSEDEEKLGTDEAGTDEVDGSVRSVHPQAFATEIAEYMHHSIDKPLDLELLDGFTPHIIVKFKKSLDHFGIRVQKDEVPVYNTSQDTYTVTEQLVNMTCLIDSSILSLTTQKTVEELCSFVIPQWGDKPLTDFYSILLLQDIICHMKEDSRLDTLRIFIQSSESKYTAIVTVLECLSQMSNDGSLNPIRTINRFKQRNPDIQISKADHIWIYETLMKCNESPIQQYNLHSFTTKHQNIYILIYNYSFSMLDKLRAFVPAINMALCSAGAQHENRSRNRSLNILPLDSERPYFGHFTPPLENKYVNATFIKGHLSPHQFVVTEWPKYHTIPAFWRLVCDHDIKRIFVIGECGCLSKWTHLTNYPLFWPTGDNKSSKSEKYNKLTVTNIGTEESDDNKTDANNITMYPLRIDEERFAPVREYQQHPSQLYHIQSWPKSREDSVELLDGLIELVRSARAHGEDVRSGTCVVSKDGAEKCGVILSLWSIMDQLEQDSTFDLFNTLRLIKLNRPKLLNTVEEISLIYRLLHRMNQPVES